MVRELRENPDFAAEYWKAAMAVESDPRVLLVALRREAEARGLAEAANIGDIERESPYRGFLPGGNPRFPHRFAVARMVELKLAAKPTR